MADGIPEPAFYGGEETVRAVGRRAKQGLCAAGRTVYKLKSGTQGMPECGAERERCKRTQLGTDGGSAEKIRKCREGR